MISTPIHEAKDETGRCFRCIYCKPVHATGGWMFYGCHHYPYSGKWVVEIEECPKERSEECGT